MSIFEYDQERHMQQEREAGIEKGRRIGLAEGEEQLLRRLVQKNLSRGMSISEIAEVLDEDRGTDPGDRFGRSGRAGGIGRGFGLQVIVSIYEIQ